MPCDGGYRKGWVFSPWLDPSGHGARKCCQNPPDWVLRRRPMPRIVAAGPCRDATVLFASKFQHPLRVRAHPLRGRRRRGPPALLTCLAVYHAQVSLPRKATIRNAMRGVRIHAPTPERSCTPYPRTAPNVGTRLEDIVYMNSAHRAYTATTYVWRAKTPPESSVQMCQLAALRRDIDTPPYWTSPHELRPVTSQ
jgi:hypothetical protein